MRGMSFFTGAIIDPYFIDDAGEALTGNGDHYRKMITEFFGAKWTILILKEGCPRTEIHL